MKKSTLRAYARLIARTGANIQKKQPVVITAELDQPEFVELLVDECYKAGAGQVEVKWTHQPLTRLDVRHQSVTSLSAVANWEIEKMKHREATRPAMIYLESDDPDGLRGIDQDKYTKAIQARRKVFKPFRDRMDNHYQWCIAAVPGVKWAKKLFPHLSKKQAVEALWDAILKASRADSDPIARWQAHNADLAGRCEWLNSLGLRKLHYRSANGTDLTVGLIENTRFVGGAGNTAEGVTYNANIPSDEIFITPKKGRAEGTVVSTMPLSYQSELIENFSITFRDGKAVSWQAEKNGHLLDKLMAMDENAGFLGECALVPYDCPINQLGLLFYNTLFDENASCHLALGAGYSECLEGFEDLSFEECTARGVNDSIVHVDFMIGAPDLAITGITADGREIPIFKNGTWA